MTILRVAAAAGLCFFLAACDGDGKSSGRAEAPPPVVTAVELARMDVPLHATFMGQTQGSHSAAIKPQVTGILQKRLFEEGSYVEKGAPLFDIDNAPYKAALEQAQGQLAQASSTLENARKERAGAGGNGEGGLRRGRPAPGILPCGSPRFRLDQPGSHYRGFFGYA